MKVQLHALKSALFAIIFLAACQNAKKDRKEPAEHAPIGAAQVADGRGFQTVTPVLATVADAYIDTDEACAGKETGTLIFNRYPGFALMVCLGGLHKFDQDYLDNKHFDIDMETPLEQLNVYVAVMTSTVGGVSDLSMISIYETATGIESQCTSTSFAHDTLRLGGSNLAKKDNANQIQAFVKEGVCSDTFVSAADQLSSVVVKRHGADDLTVALQKLELTK